MNTKLSLLSALVLALFLTTPARTVASEDEPGLDKDQVERTDKRGAEGKIIRDDYLYVIVKDRAEIKTESHLVKNVMYAERDQAYTTACKHREEGRYTVAASFFLRALEAMKEKQKWAPEYCNYGMGEAFFQAGIFSGYVGRSTGTKYDPASVYLTRALEANPKSRFMLDIVTKIPVCLAEEGKLEDAEKAWKDAETKIRAYKEDTIKINSGYNGLSDMANAKLMISGARIAEIKAQAKKESWVNVASAWGRARSNSSKFPELTAEAVDGMLRAMVNNRDFTQAKAEAQSIIEKFTKENDARQLPLLPAAYTTLGKANWMMAYDFEEKGQKVQAQQAYAEARWNFLHVVSQFFDNDEYVAGAHYSAGVCYDKLKVIEKDGGEKAIRHWKLVLQNFPRSEFAVKSEESLKAAGVAVATPAAPNTPANATKPPKAPAPNAPKK